MSSSSGSSLWKQGARRLQSTEQRVAVAEYLYNLVDESPGKVEREAQLLAADARRAEDPCGEAMALRAQALAARTRDADVAEGAARSGHRVAECAGALDIADRLRVTLAGIHLYSGRMSIAGDLLAEVVAAGREPAAAEAIAQQGLLALETGALDEAVELGRRALERLPDASIWRAHAHTNRALAQAYGGFLDEAEFDLEMAKGIYGRLGCRLAVAETLQNLGWVQDRRGDYVSALEAFSSAEPVLTEWSSSRANLLRDRATTLLAVGLAEDAATDASEAVREFADNGLHAHRAECLRISALALEQSGDAQAACEQAEEARRLFESQSRPIHADQARLIALRAVGSRTATPALASEARRLAGRLHQQGIAHDALEARLVAAQLAMRCGLAEQAARDLEEARPAIESPRHDLQIRYWETAAELASQRGLGDEALDAAGRALDVLDESHRTLGSTEARVNISAAARKVGSIAMQIAHDRGAASLFDWTERVRAGALRHRPVRPDCDGSVAAERSRLRALGHEIEERQAGGQPIDDLVDERAEAERRLRLRLLEARGTHAGTHRPGWADVQAVLDDQVLVSYAAVSGRLVAIRVDRDSIESIDLGSTADVQSELDQLRFSTVRLASGRLTGPGIDVLMAGARRLDHLVMQPVDCGNRPLVIIPMGAMFTIPWGLLPSVERRPFTVAPSATMWVSAAGDRPTARRTVFVAGPDLQHAVGEVEALAANRPDATVLSGSGASGAALLAAANGADRLHVASHGRFRGDNPMFSYLRVADGPLSVHELETLDAAPATVVLSSCDVGLTVPRRGNEWLGLATALLTVGTKSLIASVMPVPDAEPTVDLMRRIHECLDRGDEPSVALHRAVSELDLDDPSGLAVKAAFLCIGS